MPSRLVGAKLVQLQGDLLYPFQETLNKDLPVLLLYVALEMDIDEEVAAFLSHGGVSALDGDRPERLDAQQILEVQNVDDLEGPSLCVVIDVAVLGIDVQE